jgi:hypothetical protein
MTSNLRVYRLIVESWPTPDGEPWARIYGEGIAVPNHHIPEWLTPLLDDASRHCYDYNDGTPIKRVAARMRWDDDRDECTQVLMPVPKRAHYLSGPGAHRVAKDMRAFGAVVRVERSEPVMWAES